MMHMMHMMHPNLTPALLLLCTTAALGADAPPAPAQDSSRATLVNPLAAQTIERLSAIVDRPLFSPSRRGASTPPAHRDPEPRTPPSPPPNLVFSGVVMDGASARVVVLVGPERRVLRAEIGDEIGGWKVSGIAGRTLVLSLDGRFATFTLFNRDVDQRILDGGTASTNAPQPLQQQQQNPSPARSKAQN
jgi:hypothetical protein